MTCPSVKVRRGTKGQVICWYLVAAAEVPPQTPEELEVIPAEVCTGDIEDGATGQLKRALTFMTGNPQPGL